MKKVLLSILALSLVAILSVGATLAYLQDEDGAVNVMTVGQAKIEQHEYQRAPGVPFNGTANGNLVEFVQGQPLRPAVPTGKLPYTAAASDLFKWQDYVYTGTAANGLWDENKLGGNVLDKFVFVENTGAVDVYFRTVIAFECPEGTEYSQGSDKEFMMNVSGSSLYEWDEIGYTVVDGTRYLLMTATYLNPLKPGQQAHPSLLQVLMTHNVTNEDIALLGNSYEILVMSQAVQADGFKAGSKNALDTAFGAVTTDSNPWKGTNASAAVVNVGSSEALANAIAALGSNDTTIILAPGNYETNFSVDGGKNVTIVGSANAVLNGQIATTSSTAGTLTLKGVTVNVSDAIKDNTGISQTGKSAIAIWGNQKVVCENVTFNMSLKDSSAITAWWDTGVGTTIECYNCVFNCNGERPIRATGNVTVENCVFNDPYRYAIQLTAKSSTATLMDKAIINFNNNIINAGKTSTKPVYGIQLEGETYGCHDVIINGSGNEIKLGSTGKTGAMYFCECGKVDHDTIVWNTEVDAVHEKDPDFQLNMMVSVTDNAAFAAKLTEGYTNITLGSGNYIIPDSSKGKTLTIVGNGVDTVVATQDDGSYEGCDYSLDGATVTFEGITINTDSHNYTGYARLNATYNNCTINGTYTLYGDSVFNNCTFNVSGDVYNIWTWGAPNAEFNNCTFNSDGKALLLYGTVNTNLTLNGCTFNDKGGLTDKKAAVEIGNDYGKSYTLTVTDTVVNGYEINDKGTNTGSTLWGNKNSMGPDKLIVTVDGVKVYGN